MRKEKLLQFQVEASQGQNLPCKQPRKVSSRKQHFRSKWEKSSSTGFETGREGKGHVAPLRSETGGEKRMTNPLRPSTSLAGRPMSNSLRVLDYFEYPSALALSSKSPFGVLRCFSSFSSAPGFSREFCIIASPLHLSSHSASVLNPITISLCLQ